MKKIVIQAWEVIKVGGEYYLPYTHKIYFDEIKEIYDFIYLVSPVKTVNSINDDYKKLEGEYKVIELDYYSKYYESILSFPSIYKAYRDLKKEEKKISTFYTRSPSPFGWLQKYFFREEFRIVHYVGDPIDTILKNSNISLLKKIIYTISYLPEMLLFSWACRGAVVKTNGFHLKEKLNKLGVNNVEVEVSSTLTSTDFNSFDINKLQGENLKFLYVGYLRKAKGIDVVLDSFKIFNSKYPNSTLSVVGEGEFDVHEYILNNNIQSVKLHGHIECRDKLNKIYSENNIFCFASISEGSPRVILEAMANGLCVVSTPVGSLPYVFKDKKEIFFSNDVSEFVSTYEYLLSNNDVMQDIRLNGFNKVKNMTLKSFIYKVFGSKESI